MKCLLFFSDFLLSNEMSLYMENISTTIFFVHVLFLSYEQFKVYRNNMDHPVGYLMQGLPAKSKHSFRRHFIAMSTAHGGSFEMPSSEFC